MLAAQAAEDRRALLELQAELAALQAAAATRTAQPQVAGERVRAAQLHQESLQPLSAEDSAQSLEH
eukprot:6212016-Pleurochrysis_carterae.AAC.4